jgi:hypothetical protein
MDALLSSINSAKNIEKRNFIADFSVEIGCFYCFLIVKQQIFYLLLSETKQQKVGRNVRKILRCSKKVIFLKKINLNLICLEQIYT